MSRVHVCKTNPPSHLAPPPFTALLSFSSYGGRRPDEDRQERGRASGSGDRRWWRSRRQEHTYFTADIEQQQVDWSADTHDKGGRWNDEGDHGRSEHTAERDDAAIADQGTAGRQWSADTDTGTR